jgi:long-chain fatty acid transport protein
VATYQSVKNQFGGRKRMKKVLTCVGGLVLSCAVAATVFAGAVDNKTNWSAEYIRTLNRNAATDYADIAAYNPAGTVKLEEGFIINGSIQFLAKDYKNIVNSVEYESDEPSYIPGVFGVYNRGKWSLFGAFSNYGGGGKVDYSEGNYTSNLIAAGISAQSGGVYQFPPTAQNLTAESRYLGYSIGGAFSINEMFSVSLSGRYIDASKEADGSVTLGSEVLDPLTRRVAYEQDSSGWGGIIGLNIAPNDALNIGFRYETETDLDFENTVLEGEDILVGIGIIDGEEVTRNLPALMALGVSYKFSDKLRVEADLTYYFNKSSEWSGAEENVENGFDIGFAVEYLFTDKLLGSFGYLYTKLGMDPEYMLPENPELDASTLGAGIAYAFTEKFHGNFSVGNTFYTDDSFAKFPPEGIGYVEYQKSIFFLAFGLEYRFL